MVLFGLACIVGFVWVLFLFGHGLYLSLTEGKGRDSPPPPSPPPIDYPVYIPPTPKRVVVKTREPKNLKKKFYLVSAKGRVEITEREAKEIKSSAFYKSGSVIEE